MMSEENKNIEKAMERDEELLKKLRMENKVYKGKDRKLGGDSVERGYDYEIGNSLASLANVSPDSSQYTKTVKNISTLTESKQKYVETRHKREAIWSGVIGSLAGISLVLVGEKICNIIITGKASNFIKKS